MGKKPKHARGNSPWWDALKRAVRPIRTELTTVGAAVASEVAKVLLQ
ncbi:hypothetical protein ABZX75_17595 [Streptomyces sp. NPDC003038]